MDRRSFRAVLNVMEPPMAFRVLNVTRAAVWACCWHWKCTFQYIFACYTHFSDSIPDPAKLGQFIDAFFSDDCAVHIETHSFGSPEKFLRLREGRHRAAKAEWHSLKDAQAATHKPSRCFRPVNEALKAMDVFDAVKHQIRPFTKTAMRKRFAHTQLISTKEKCTPL